MGERPLKSGWTRVKFGDVVHLNTERCADPAAAGIERYVGLDHIDPEDLRLRRWGQVADGTTFTNLFRPGQVLFGKRRAYQRKVAVADFEGVCSGDIYVFETQDSSRLLPELLPFICQTDGFFEYAVNTSAGSLSPRTNWTHLVQYEFALPPLEEQARIVGLMQALSLVEDQLYSADVAGTSLLQSVTNSLVSGNRKQPKRETPYGPLPSEWPLVRLRDAMQSTQYGLSLNAQQSGRYPILGMTNIADGHIIETESAFVDLSNEEFERYKLEFGDVLFNRTNSYELVGRTGIYKLSGEHVFASYVVRVRTDRQRLIADYLAIFLNSALGRHQVMSFATRGVSQANVNASNLGRVLIPLPSVAEQAEIVAWIESVHAESDKARFRRQGASALHKMMLSNALGGSAD